MNGFTSDELKTINKALDFYKYQMNKTTNMDEYRAWESTQKKFNERLGYRHGVWSLEGGGMKLYALVYKDSGELAKSWGSSTKPSLKVFDNLESAKRSLKSSQHREKEELAIKTYVEVVE